MSEERDTRAGRPLMVSPWLRERLEELAKAVGAQLSLFDESKVSRHARGPKGGQFAPKGGGGGGGGGAKAPAKAPVKAGAKTGGKPTTAARPKAARKFTPSDEAMAYLTERHDLPEVPLVPKGDDLDALNERIAVEDALDEMRVDGRQSGHHQTRAMLSELGYDDRQVNDFLSEMWLLGAYNDARVARLEEKPLHAVLRVVGRPKGGLAAASGGEGEEGGRETADEGEDNAETPDYATTTYTDGQEAVRAGYEWARLSGKTKYAQFDQSAKVFRLLDKPPKRREHYSKMEPDGTSAYIVRE